MQRSKPLLGTFVTITVSSSDRPRALSAISEAFLEFERVDRLMSIHRADSELSQINAAPAGHMTQVSAELRAVLSKALEIARVTRGAFDPTIRPVAQLWGFIWKEHRFPPEEELRGAVAKVNYRVVKLTKSGVFFSREGHSLDLNGIAKGYAVDRAVLKLRDLGFTNVFVKAGGDLRVSGAPPGERFWTVQLEDPNKQGNRISIPLRNAALSTSGSYENFFEVNGKRYSHILNPKTGYPVEGLAACTVIAPTCMESDALATAFMVLGPEETMAKFGDAYGIRFTLMPKEGSVEMPAMSNAPFPKPL